ncbi:MAG: hypothetical protein V2A79_14105, partial [Planctomycetota bacterium]
GIVAVDGTATTFMRSDGAPALDVSISPAWTGTHLWKRTTDAVAGWEIQDQDGNVIVNVDSVNNRVGIGTATPAATLDLGAGGQIQFPATQNPSSGANVLDDYEEGTWTPVIGGSGGTSGQTYTNQYGYYTKCGDVVVAQWWASLSNKGTITGDVQIQGLPFVACSANFAYHYGSISFANLATNWNLLQLQTWLGSSAAFVVGLKAAGTSSQNNTSTADIANITSIMGTVVYKAG